MNERESSIDLIKGVGIILLVIGHSYPGPFTFKVLASFLMPLFFIISGWLFNFTRYEKAPWTLFVRRVQQLMVPYVILGILFSVINISLLSFALPEIFFDLKSNPLKFILGIVKSVAYGCGTADLCFLNVDTVGVMWFIPCLFIAEMIFFFLLKIFINKHPVLQLLAFCLISYPATFIKQALPWSIDAAIAFQIFLLVGFLAKRYNIFSKFNNWYLLILLIIWFYDIHSGVFEVNRRDYNNPLISFPGAIAGSLLIMYVLRKLYETKRFSLLISWISWIGSGTLIILCFHYQDQHHFAFDIIMPEFFAIISMNIFVYVTIRLLFCVVIIFIIKSVPFLNDLFFPFRQKPLPTANNL